MAVAMKSETTFSVTGISDLDARGLRRCVTPGVGCSSGGKSSSVADFWRSKDGAVLMRISWMGYSWSFRALTSSGEPIPNEKRSMDAFGDFVIQELLRWVSEDAADLSPFEDEEWD